MRAGGIVVGRCSSTRDVRSVNCVPLLPPPRPLLLPRPIYSSCRAHRRPARLLMTMLAPCRPRPYRRPPAAGPVRALHARPVVHHGPPRQARPRAAARRHDAGSRPQDPQGAGGDQLQVPRRDAPQVRDGVVLLACTASSVRTRDGGTGGIPCHLHRYVIGAYLGAGNHLPTGRREAGSGFWTQLNRQQPTASNTRSVGHVLGAAGYCRGPP